MRISLHRLFRVRRATVLGIGCGVATIALATTLYSQQRLPTWSLEPALRLGSLDGPYAFAALGSVVVSPRTGSVFVEEGSQRILAFDSTGKKLTAFGRNGDGPGEFRHLNQISWSDGKIVAFDVGSSRVSWFTEPGEVVDSRRIEPDPHSEAGLHAFPWAPLGKDHFVGMVRQDLPDGKLMQNRVRLLRMDGNGNDTILDQFPEVGRHVPTTGGIWLPIPMVPGSVYAADPHGSGIVVVHQYEPRTGAPGTFRVRKIGADGRVVFSRTYPYTPSQLPKGYVEEQMERQRDAVQRLGLKMNEVNRLINRYLPDFFTPISEVLMGADGSIWLKRQTAETDRTWWWVLNERGDLVARLHLPQRLRVRYVDAETVWGVDVDALGVNYLVKYRIIRE